MQAFYGTRLSEHRAVTPEGYLICYDTPIARVGVQQYLGSEIGQDKDICDVYRVADEIFKPAAMASFEGKSFTNNHPFKNLDIDTALIYEKGQLHNIHKSPDGQYLLADIVIKDKQTIDDINNGKVELSAGYDCDIVDIDGKLTQVNIIGNHVALVNHGRAGEKVKIYDTQKVEKEEKGVNKMSEHKKTLAKLFKAFCKDAEPEEVIEALDMCAKDETPAEQKAEDDKFAELQSRIAELEAKLAAVHAEDEDKEEEKTALDELEENGIEDADHREIIREADAIAMKPASEFEGGEEEKFRTLTKKLEELGYTKSEAHDADLNNDPKLIEALAEKAQSDEDTVAEMKKDIADAKKVVGKIQDSKVRKEVADSLAKLIRSKSKNHNYSRIMDSLAKPQERKQEIDVNAIFKGIKDNYFRK